MTQRNEEEFIKKLNSVKGQSLTYKKLCELLNEPIKSSDSKKKQIDELSEKLKNETNEVVRKELAKKTRQNLKLDCDNLKAQGIIL